MEHNLYMLMIFYNMLIIFGIKEKIYNIDPYNLLLAIATNIPVLLKTVLWSRVTYNIPFNFGGF